MNELNNTIASIGAGLSTESWMPRSEADPIHDFRIQNEGNIAIIWADSKATFEWVWEHLPEEIDRWGANGFAIESRYIAPVVAGMRRDGLMYDTDVADAQEEMHRQFEAQQALDDQNCGEGE